MLDGLPIVGFAVTDGPEVFRCCDVGRSGGDEQESRRGGEHNKAAAVVNKQGGGRLESASGGPEIKIKFGWSKKLKFCKKLDSIMSRKTGIQRTVNGPRAEF